MKNLAVLWASICLLVCTPNVRASVLNFPSISVSDLRINAVAQLGPEKGIALFRSVGAPVTSRLLRPEDARADLTSVRRAAEGKIGDGTEDDSGNSIVESTGEVAIIFDFGKAGAAKTSTLVLGGLLAVRLPQRSLSTEASDIHCGLREFLETKK